MISVFVDITIMFSFQENPIFKKLSLPYPEEQS